MIRASLTSNGRRILILGFTDVNMKRLFDGKPMRVAAAELVPAKYAQTPLDNTEIVVFYATRESLLELAEVSGTDAKDLLDQLGEG